eukprot:scaffold23454_cov72-Skeletonema_dohrnii-CCMP3373.AAC.2
MAGQKALLSSKAKNTDTTLEGSSSIEHPLPIRRPPHPSSTVTTEGPRMVGGIHSSPLIIDSPQVCVLALRHWRQGESTLRSVGTKWLLQLSELRG